MRQVFGGLLLGLGILIAGLSGLCTVLVVATSLMDSGGGEDYGVGSIALVIGGIPFVIGLVMLFAGRALLRRKAGVGDPPGSSDRDEA